MHKEMKTIFPLLKELYEIDGLVLVGEDPSLWKEISEEANLKDVHYFNLHEQKLNSFPSEWQIHEELLAKEDGTVPYYDLSNSQLSGTIPGEALTPLWRNLKTVQQKEKKALSLETLLSQLTAKNHAFVVDSFDAINIVQSSDVDIVIAKTIKSDEESLSHYSKSTLDAHMQKLGYKLLMLIEEKHPQVFTVVYGLDKEKQTEKLIQQLQEEHTNELETLSTTLREKTKEGERLAQEQTALKEEAKQASEALEAEKTKAASLQKEKEELSKSLQERNGEIEKLKNELKTKTETLTKLLEEEKQNSENLKKEIETLSAELQTQTQENQKLKNEQNRLHNELETLSTTLREKTKESERLSQEQAALKEEIQKTTQALETERAKVANIQKEKEEINKALQEKNGEIEKLKNELKTKTEALKEKQKRLQSLQNKSIPEHVSEGNNIKEDIKRISKNFEIQISSVVKKLNKKEKKEKEVLEKIKREQKLIRKSLNLLQEKEKSIDSIIAKVKRLKGKLFIDCGGYDGCSAIKFLLQNPDYDVVTFEPNPEMWDYYKDIPTRLIKKAVMHYDGIVDFTIDPVDGDGSSVIKEKKIDATNKVSNDECPVTTVACSDLSAFIKKQSKKYGEIILKLDIEGAEYKVIQKIADDGNLDLIDKIYAEFHWKKIELLESEHDKIVALIKNKLVSKEWDSLEFSIHKKEKFTHKIRKEVLEHIQTERGR